MIDTSKSGVLCPVCSTRGAKTLYTRHGERRTVRVRRCARCGHRYRTQESIICAVVPGCPSRGARRTKS